MDLLENLNLQDGQGVDLADYGMVFEPGITNFSGNIFGVIIDFLYVAIQFLTGIAAWLAEMLAKPSGLFGSVEDAFTSAVEPLFDIIPLPALVTLAIAISIAAVGFTKTRTPRDALASDGKRILIAILAGSLIVYLSTNPFFLASGVSNTTTGIIRDIFSDNGGVGGGTLLDTFLRPLTQMINFNTILSDSCNAQWSAAVSDNGSITCVQSDSIEDPGAAQAFAAILGIVVALIVLIFQVFATALMLFHFINALIGSVVVLYAAVIALARRHNFDFLSRNIGFTAAHLLMLFAILVIGVAGPAAVMGFASAILGDSTGSGRLFATIIFLPLGYALLAFLMWKLASRTGRVAQFLRINSNKKIGEEYGVGGKSMLDDSGAGDVAKVPEAAIDGKLGTAAAWGLGGTGMLEKMLRNKSLGDNQTPEAHAEGDEMRESGMPASYPDPASGDDGQQAAGSRQGQPNPEFTDAQGRTVGGYATGREVFDDFGRPVTGWEIDPESGEYIPTTFDKEGNPLPPVDKAGNVNEVFDRNGERIYLFPTSNGSKRGTFLSTGQRAPEREAPPLVEPANNPYGEPQQGGDPEEESALDEGYTEEPPNEAVPEAEAEAEDGVDGDDLSELEETAEHQDAEDSENPAGDSDLPGTGDDGAGKTPATPEPAPAVTTTHSVADDTGAGMHGSTITPVPPVRYTPAPEGLAGGDHPGYGNYELDNETLDKLDAASRAEESDRRMEVESEALDDLSEMNVVGGSGGQADPAVDQGAYSVDQPEVENVEIHRIASLRDPLSGAREQADREVSRFEQLAAGGSSYTPINPLGAQMELDLEMDEGSPSFRPSHHVNLDGSII